MPLRLDRRRARRRTPRRRVAQLGGPGPPHRLVRRAAPARRPRPPAVRRCPAGGDTNGRSTGGVTTAVLSGPSCSSSAPRVGGILAASGTHIEDEHGGWLNGGSPPGSGLVNAGAVFLLVAAAIALVWLYRVVDRHVFTPIFQELQIALGPLPPVEALRHPDGTPLSAEEQAVARWQLAQRQAQARQQIALLGLVLWFGHHQHGGGGNHGS